MVLHTKRGRAIAIAVSKTPRETFAVTATLERDGTRATTPTRESLAALKMHFGLTRESVREWMCLEDLPAGAVYDEKTEATRIGFVVRARAFVVKHEI